MAKSRFGPMPISSRPADHSDGGGRVWKWVLISGLAHVALIAALLIVPFLPDKSADRPVPVYSVDLVGGEKLGAGAGTALEPTPKAKPIPAAPEVETAPPVKETKTKKTKETAAVKPNPAELKDIDKVTLAAKSKKEAEQKKKLAEEAEAQKAREKIEELRKKRSEAAIAELRAKIEERQRQQQLQEAQQKAAAEQQARSTVAGNTPGAAGPGVGGTGGGIKKDAEFIRYQNIISDRVKNSWTWVGRRTDLKVTVNVSIQENGEITGVKLVGTSGDRSFDDSVIRAIRRANPLSPPPEAFRKEFSDVILTFSAKELGS